MKIQLIFLLLLGCSVFTGCAPRNHTERGALVGSTAGAILGGVLGHQTGNADDGAVLGALAGGLTGAVVGNDKDMQEMAVEEQIRQAEAVTNLDLIRMTQSGVSDDVIINTVKTRGGHLDMSPDAVIELKANGVSDYVVLEIQKAAQAAAEGKVVRVTSSRPEIVVIPAVGVGVGVRNHHHPYWHRPRPRVGFHWHYSR